MINASRVTRKIRVKYVELLYERKSSYERKSYVRAIIKPSKLPC